MFCSDMALDGWFLFPTLAIIAAFIPHRSFDIVGFDWKDGDEGKVKWDHNCQYFGDTIAREPSPNLGSECGQFCLENDQCTHFTYSNGSCFLMSFPSEPPAAKFVENSSCGWVVGLKWNELHLESGSVKSAHDCNFALPDDDKDAGHPKKNMTTEGWESCAKGCIMMHGCTHYVYHSRKGVCEMKTFAKFIRARPSSDTNCGFVDSRNIEIPTTTQPPIDELSPIHITSIVIPLAVIAVLLALLGRSIYLNKRRNRLQRDVEMKRLMDPRGFQTLLDGSPELINPDGPLENQVALLPYNPKWEFPRDRLKLEKQVAVGHFGVVYLGSAIVTSNAEGETPIPVAVKMVKSQSDPMAFESLVSELKILSHIGPHLNVVNLIGACTQDVTQGSLLVILEFCSYGSLHSYVISNREGFVNQLDDHGDLMELQGDALEAEHTVGNDGYLLPLVNNEENRRTSDLTEGEGHPPLLCTRTLICWSFQIAQGMDYLTEKRVLHGDLAARNILLAEGNVVKIADFGLSRQIKYNDGKYQKQGEEALPVKWMAIESLTDRLFSTQSDVWSYGVLLWELFSLGSMPYADVTTVKELIHFLLKEGQRLTKPHWAPNNVVDDLMKACWQTNPKDRPSFAHLKHTLAHLMEPSAYDHYEKLIKPYVE